MESRNIYNKNVRLNRQKNFDKYKYLKRFVFKIVAAIIILLSILLLKKLNFTSTNKLLYKIEKNIKYEFSFTKDGKRILNKTKEVLDSSVDALMVFNTTSKVKYESPIIGEVYKGYKKSVNNGIDIKSNGDGEVVSVSDGIIKDIKMNGNKGYFVTINMDNIDFIYGYLSSVNLSKGDSIESGEVIGSLGTNKDGSKYLRIEVWIDGIPVNPLDYIEIK